MTRRLSDLREPPVEGRSYLVPAISYPYFGAMDVWPVFGPMHTDVEFLHFPHAHYHVDARFLTARQHQRLLTHAEWGGIETVVGRWPLKTMGTALPTGRPGLIRRRCRRAGYGHAFQNNPTIEAMRAHYGHPAPAVRLADGRVLCPHRKADLTQLPPDDAGNVLCPLHGLKVCVGVSA